MLKIRTRRSLTAYAWRLPLVALSTAISISAAPAQTDPTTQPGTPAPKATQESAPAPDDAKATDSPQPAVAPEGTPAGTTLEGSVHASIVSALNSLRLAGKNAAQLRQAAGALYDEVSTPQVQMVDEPELIGGVVISLPISYQTGQLLPPRAKWVDHDMEELGQVFALLQGDLNEIVIPAENRQTAQPLFAELTSVMQDIQRHYQNLQKLTAAKDNYDVATIAIESASIHKDVEQFEEARKKLYKAIRDKD